LVQENSKGKENHKHNHEKHEKELTAEGSVSREEFDQPQLARKTVVKKLKSSGIPKCQIKNITGHTYAQGLDKETK